MKQPKNKETGEKICRDFELRKAARVNWDSYWLELAQYFLPNKDDVYGYKTSGEQKGNTLYDSTPIHALEMLASSLHGMLTNPASVWFGLSTGISALDNDHEVKTYLQSCTNTMIEALNQSNFQEEIHETYLDLGGIGTTVLAIEEDDESDIRFKSTPIYGSYISENHKGVVDTLYREWDMSLRNIKGKFGAEVFDAHEDLVRKLAKDPEQKEKIIYAIYPDPDKKGKWKACYVLQCKKFLLKEEMFHSFPFAVPRWTKLNNEEYGRSPSMKCFADTKMLQAVMKVTIRGMQKVVDPPLMIPDNGFLLPINTTPGGSNFYRQGIKDRIEPFPTTARPDVGVDFLENIRSRINQAFFWDQLQLIQQRDMTATEVMQRTDERLRFLGPILGRLHNELLKPIIDRSFDILRRRGKFPKPPAALKGNADLKIIYTSQIAKAQRTGEANTLNKILQACGPMLQVQPDMLDNLNGDGIIRYFANTFGAPAEMLNPEKQVAKTREARQQQQQAMMQAEQDKVAAETAATQAKAQIA